MQSFDIKTMFTLLVIGVICLYFPRFTQACSTSSKVYDNTQSTSLGKRVVTINSLAERLLRARFFFSSVKSTVEDHEIFIDSLTVKNCSLHQNTTEIYECIAFAQNIETACVS